MIYFRVLIVDDDEDDRFFLEEALLRAGIAPVLTLSTAQDVFNCLQKVQCDEQLPRLIITDLNMPGLNGHELLLALREKHRYQHIPVIICSTSSLSVDVTKCITAGAKRYVTKPDTFDGYEKLVH